MALNKYLRILVILSRLTINDVAIDLFKSYISNERVKEEKERKSENIKMYGVGVSKSAAKRRAKKLERCLRCGKFEHIGFCSKNQTTSNCDFIELCWNGPIRLKAEKTFRKDSMARNAFGRFDHVMNNRRDINSRTKERV